MAVRDQGIKPNPLADIPITVEFEDLLGQEQLAPDFPQDDRVSAEFTGNALLTEIFEGVVVGPDSNNLPGMVYHQEEPSSEWVITHLLGRYPGVTVIDSDGDTCFCEIEYVDEDELILVFSEEITGTAYLH